MWFGGLVSCSVFEFNYSVCWWAFNGFVWVISVVYILALLIKVCPMVYFCFIDDANSALN